MRKLRVLDLFSGIGGFSLGLESTGYYETVAFCEIEEYPRKVLKKHWPEVPIHDDIHTLRGEDYQGVDLVCGGFPCQPVSLAGRRKGKEDKRWLWPEFSRVIREARPRWCLIENVPGLRTQHADEVLADLEEQGYACWPLVVGAVHAGAPHRRQRVWIVAHAAHNGARWRQQQSECGEGEGSLADVADANGAGLEKHAGIGSNAREEQPTIVGGNRHSAWDWSRAPEPMLRGVDDGLPCGVDRRKRLTALGNSIVPQIAATLGRSILVADILY